MSQIYDNWERLVSGVIRREELWQLFHDQSRSPSIRSEASNVSFALQDLLFNSSSSELPSSPYQETASNPVLELVFISKTGPRYDTEEILRADAIYLGNGTFGNTYKVVMDNGTQIYVARRLKFGRSSISQSEFERQMEIVGNIRHENIAPLRAYCSSKYHKLMLYDYCGEESVSSLLHGRKGDRAHLHWETRRRIAVGAARAITYIHAQKGGTLVHGNVKSSNIFLNPQGYGRVTDLGLASLFIPGKFNLKSHYHAPEVKIDTQNVSHASDVYSFGILLLELLTRKNPSHETLDLVKWVKSIDHKEWINAKVLDVDLLKYPGIEEPMVNMLQIGISCVAKSPKKRPKMSKVLKMIEGISNICVEQRLLFFDDGNHSFDYKMMMSARTEMLGKGTFGVSYIARLENGNIILMKALKEADITSKGFLQHMKEIARLQHKNVAELKACWRSRDQLILIYGYYNQESLSTMLYGADKKSLDLKSRLKIAVGAARGIAHIHTQNLVHGNIKSSNICLNSDQFGCVSDVGLAALASPIPLSRMPTPGYYAPEVKESRNVSQASDVYSFGVMLLELLTGNNLSHITQNDKLRPIVSWIESFIRYEGGVQLFDGVRVEVFDEILMDKNYAGENMVMLKLLRLALKCVTHVPECRPKMAEVVRILEECIVEENLMADQQNPLPELTL